ncbi:hypothetical protein [Agrobacterium tumefaciens]|uniref:hypothetical protein n=1 Tax=Agrobacterium tumefaciens TaxID=358 RepID=UPI003B9FDF8D
MSVLSIPPFDTKSISELVVGALQEKGWAHLVPFVLSAKAVRRWDFDTWIGAFYFVSSEKNYLRLFFSTSTNDAALVDFVCVSDGVTTTSFADGAWQINSLQGFSVQEALRSKAKLTVRFFESPRVWDSIYYACSVGVAAESQGDEYLFYSLSPEKSLINPRVVYKKSSFKAVKVDRSELLTAHLLKTAHHRVSGREMKAFLARALPRPEPDGKTLFISLEAEKRVWVNQLECLSKFIREVQPSRIVFNGMTAPVAGREHCNFPEQEAHEKSLIDAIMAASGWNCEVVNIFGYSFHDKLNEIRKCSFFLTPGGSAFVIPSVLGIPGVISANASMINWRRDLDGAAVARMPVEAITDVPSEKGIYDYSWGGPNESLSFHIDEATFLNVALSNYRATLS